MKIGFIGTQSGMTPFQRAGLWDVLELFKCTEFCHGDLIGASKDSNQIAMDYGVKIFTLYPPLDGKKRAWCFNPEHQRMEVNIYHPILFPSDNRVDVKWMPLDSYMNAHKEMIDNVDRIIAAPKEHQHTLKSAVWTAIRYVWKIKKDLTIIPPIKDEENTNG